MPRLLRCSLMPYPLEALRVRKNPRNPAHRSLESKIASHSDRLYFCFTNAPASLPLLLFNFPTSTITPSRLITSIAPSHYELLHTTAAANQSATPTPHAPFHPHHRRRRFRLYVSLHILDPILPVAQNRLCTLLPMFAYHDTNLLHNTCIYLICF